MSDKKATDAALKLTALTPAQVAKLLSTAKGDSGVTEETIQADLEAGAPVNADGTINLVHYAAWLVRELATRGD